MDTKLSAGLGALMRSDSFTVSPTASNSETSDDHDLLDATIFSDKSYETTETVNSLVDKMLDAESFSIPFRPRAIEMAMEGGFVDTPIK